MVAALLNPGQSCHCFASLFSCALKQLTGSYKRFFHKIYVDPTAREGPIGFLLWTQTDGMASLQA
jgi:hypothetical protein